MSTTVLQALSQIICNGVGAIETSCADRGETYPSLDDSYDAKNIEIQDRYAQDAAPIIAAACQLIATLSRPKSYLID